jgi:Gluconate 2-dehydrogenase subunit 3
MTTVHSRREVILLALRAAGITALAGSGTLLSACASGTDRRNIIPNSDFSAAQIAWLDEVAETILPTTDTPGAKAAGVGAFIALMVTDTYSPEERRIFMDGMTTLEAECITRFQRGYMEADAKQRHELLTHLDKVAHEHGLTLGAEDPPHSFRMIKQLTLLGYFTSEIGYTQAMRYVESPGRWDPCVDYTPGERAWARHA